MFSGELSQMDDEDIEDKFDLEQKLIDFLTDLKMKGNQI